MVKSLVDLMEVKLKLIKYAENSQNEKAKELINSLPSSQKNWAESAYNLYKKGYFTKR